MMPASVLGIQIANLVQTESDLNDRSRYKEALGVRTEEGLEGEEGIRRKVEG